MLSTLVCHSEFGIGHFQQQIYQFLNTSDIFPYYLSGKCSTGRIPNLQQVYQFLNTSDIFPYYLSGKCSTGSITNLHFISSKAICCSCPHINCLTFLVKSYIGCNNFCTSGQNILRKFTIPAKPLHPVTVIGSLTFK